MKRRQHVNYMFLIVFGPCESMRKHAFAGQNTQLSTPVWSFMTINRKHLIRQITNHKKHVVVENLHLMY